MPTSPQRTGSGAPSVLVVTGAHAAAGESAPVRVHARNVTDAPQDLVVSTLGLETSWLPASQRVPGVAAGQTATVELVVTPPVGVAPGDYAFVVVVEARGAGGAVTTVAEASVRVDGATGLVVSVEPARSEGVFGRSVTVVVANAGEEPVRVRLDAAADDGAAVRLSRTGLEVPGHHTTRLRGRVRPLRPRLVGGARQFGFRVVATGNQAKQRVDGVLTAPALLRGGVLRAVAIVAVASVWVAAVLTALPWVSAKVSGASSSSASAPTATVTIPAGTGPGAGAGSGTAGGTGSGTAGGSGAGAGSAAATGVRVSGVVAAGANPSGVTVQVSPASALAAATASPAAVATGALAAVVRANPIVRLADALLGRDHTPTDAGKVYSLALPVEGAGDSSQRLTSTTDATGTWAFGGLSATGRYLIVLAKPGYQTQRYLVTGAEAAALPLKTTLKPGDGHLSGVVTGPAGPAGGVVVTLTDGTTTVTTRTATSGNVGHWQVDGLSTPSTYLVSASSTTLGVQSLLVPLPAAGTRAVDLPLNPGVTTLSGTVAGVDALGDVGGLGGLTVTASSGDVSRTATTTTGDHAGSFVLPDLPVPAHYTLTIAGAGYATQTRQLDLTPAGLPALGITMTSIGGTVLGTVTEPGGTGLAGAGLTLVGPTGTYKTMSASDATGSFRFSGIAAGQYVLTAEVYAHVPASTQVTVTPDGTATADLTLAVDPSGGVLATAHITGRVTDAATGARLQCPQLLPGEKCQATITATATGTTLPPVTTNPDTPYVIPGSGSSGLLPGRYTLTITAPGYEPGHVVVVVPMGQSVEAATVALYQSPSTEGMVLARVGSVPSSTCVVAVAWVTGAPAPTSAPPCTTTDSGVTCSTGSTTAFCAYVGLNGSYSIKRLAGGTYSVFVAPGVAPGQASSEYVPPAPATLTLTPGDVKRYDVTLDRLGVLDVTVQQTDPAGVLQPAASALVFVNSAHLGTTDPNGTAQVRGIQPGTYPVYAQAGGVTNGPTSRTVSITVGLNQEIAVPLVLQAAVASVPSARVVTLLGSTADTPVGGAVVKVTGVTGYSGAAPLRSSATATTNATGYFALCTDPTNPCNAAVDGSVMTLPLVESVVDVEVTAAGYAPLTMTGIPLSQLQTITVSPLGVHFWGAVSFVPAVPVGTTPPTVTMTITAAAPGTGALSASVDPATGNVLWSDTSQPADTTAGFTSARLIRPGTYTVTASAPGYALVSRTFTVQPGVPMSQQVLWPLPQDGLLRVCAVSQADTTVPVLGAVMQLNLTTTTSPITADQNCVSFGSMAVGTYSVTVHAPGWATFTGTVAVAAGQSAAVQVLMTQMGTITGQVVSQLAPGWTQALPGAAITAQKSTVTFGATTDKSGNFAVTGTTQVDGLSVGPWTVGAYAGPDYQDPASGGSSNTVTAKAAILASDPGATVSVGTLALAPLPASLLVQVVDGAGKPVSGLTVALSYTDGTGHSQTVSPCTKQGPGACSTGGGSYQFLNLLPLTYTLSISSTGAYQSLSQAVTVTAGSSGTVTVNITQPQGSVQGTVLHQLVGGGAQPVPGATVTLTPATGKATSVTSGTDGTFLFTPVAPGTYTLATALPSDPTVTTSRPVTVQPGQGLVVDLTLLEQSRQVTVTLTSVNHTDLSGAVVTLSQTGGTGAVIRTLAPQPVVPGSAADTFTTTFNQVPYGTGWSATSSGPAGHLGTWSSGAFTVKADPMTMPAITVKEMTLALRATSTAASPPTSLNVTLTQGSGTAAISLQVTAFVGGSDAVVYVPATAATTVTTATSSVWQVTMAVTPAGAGSGGTSATVTASTTSTVTSALVTIALADVPPPPPPATAAATAPATPSPTATATAGPAPSPTTTP
jgi:hypothetical protein